DPGAAAFSRSRGDAHLVRRDYAAALCDFQRAHALLTTALPAGAAPVLVKIARCRLHLGEHAPAMLAVREALSIDPAGAAALALKKRLAAIESGVEAYQHARARRQWRAARLAYGSCAKAYTEDGTALPVAIRCWEVEVAVAEAQWAEALPVSAGILATHPRSAEALRTRAEVLFFTADLGEALRQVVAALKLDPDDDEAKAARARYKGVMDLKEEGNTHWRSGDSGGAVEKWTSALELVGEKEEEGGGGRIRAILLLNRSRAHLKLGQHPDALKDANAAEKRDPDNVKIVVTRARIYVGLELFDSAIQEFKAALQADASKLSAVDRRTVQGELDNVEERAMRERTKVKDYYEILGLDRNCTTAEIRKAYRAQSLKNHPDKGGIAEKFRLVQEAYNTLSDPTKRWSYD
ncbi:DnaJ-domain-containing protein, partial [Daedalea quercina L-15889]